MKYKGPTLGAFGECFIADHLTHISNKSRTYASTMTFTYSTRSYGAKDSSEPKQSIVCMTLTRWLEQRYIWLLFLM